MLFIYESSFTVSFFLKKMGSQTIIFSQKIVLTIHFKICFEGTAFLPRKCPLQTIFLLLRNIFLPTLSLALLLHVVYFCPALQ